MVVAKHQPTDPQKLASLRDAFEASGEWPDTVPPVLTVGDKAITGAHRLAAAKAAGLADYQVRRIDLLEEGVDFEALGYTLEELLTTADDWDIARMLQEAGRPDLAALAVDGWSA